jgi:hypothetical protein
VTRSRETAVSARSGWSWPAGLFLIAMAWPASARAAEPPAPTFAEVIGRYFPVWDLNHDGLLDSSEVDRLMNVPSIRGEAAAALAAIKLRERKLRPAERPRYAAKLDELSGTGGAGPLRKEVPDQGGVHAEATAHFPYQTHFRSFLSELDKLPERLYAHERPEFPSLRQGPIGDCFFFSVTGALAARDPGRIVAMIEPQPDAAFLVRFPGEPPVRVPPLTQAEVLVNNSASTLDDGLWPVVLEKAVGAVLRSRADSRTAEPTDSIAHGGSTREIMSLYTGHTTWEFTLRSPEFAPERLAEIRQILPETLNHGKLATAKLAAAQAGEAKVPHLGYNHAYAVLGFDRASDVLTLWNPWGDTFTPKGPDGPELGFTTKHGVFQIPLETFYHTFASLRVETSVPITPGWPTSGRATWRRGWRSR